MLGISVDRTSNTIQTHHAAAQRSKRGRRAALGPPLFSAKGVSQCSKSSLSGSTTCSCRMDNTLRWPKDGRASYLLRNGIRQGFDRNDDTVGGRYVNRFCILSATPKPACS